MPRRSWHQFTVRRLLFLTTVIAALYAATWSVPLPDAFPQLFYARLIIAGVLTLVIVVATIRVPILCEGLKDVRRRYRQLKIDRRLLADEAEALRQRGRQHSPASNASSPEAPDSS